MSTARAVLKVKRSEFKAILKPVYTQEDFQHFLKLIRKEFHNARHMCWAYRLSDTGMIENSSDSGEPSGSAGIPILNALRSSNAVQSAIVVVRYFGGVKLGKKGLINAYGSAALAVCQESKWKNYIQKDVYIITGDFSQAGKLEYWLNNHSGKRIKELSMDRLIWEIEIPVITDLKDLRILGVDVKKRSGHNQTKEVTRREVG